MEGGVLKMRAYQPLPFREEWAPSYLKSRGDANVDYAFRFPDAQGAPASDGRRFHSAADIFAPGGTPVLAPVPGRVVESTPSRGNSGQVFGGVVKVRDPSGMVWTHRHVDPDVPYGAEVAAGQQIARVSAWRDGGPHDHLEIWRSLGGGYRHENMIDPRSVEWLDPDDVAERPTPPAGATLRLALHDGARAKRWAGWEEAGGALRWIKSNGLRPRTKVALAWRGSLWRYNPATYPNRVEITRPDGATRHVVGDARYVARVATTIYRRHLA